MKPLAAVILLLVLVGPQTNSQTNPDTVNGWYFLSVRGGQLGDTYSRIYPGENSGVCQMFHYRTVTPGVRTYITWEKRYDPGFVTPQFFVIRTRIHGPEPSQSYATAKLYFGDDDSTFGIGLPGHGEILLTAGDSMWQDVRYSTGLILTPRFNRIRIEFSFELPPTLPAIAEYEFDSLTGTYPEGNQILIEPFGNAGITTATDAGTAVPTSYALDQNYPNPFNPSSTIGFSLPEAGMVRLTIFDALGREVTTLLSSTLPAGTYRRTWDASGYAGGVYLYRLQAGSFIQTRKLLLLK